MKEVFPFYSIGHFINQPGSQTEFEIMRFEGMEEPDVEDVHKHNFYEILWVEKGVSKQTIDYKEYEVTPGSLFFISPNQVHEFEKWKPLQGGTILFTDGFFLQNQYNKDKLFELSFLDNFYANPCMKFNRKDFAELRQTIELMIAEYERKDSDRTILQSFLHILLSQVQRCINHESAKPVSKKYLILYKQFKTLLDTHFVENKTPAFYAKHLHITPHHLNMVVKNVTGKTASQIIRSRSILEAKRLLTFTDLTISEVAAELHFFDSSYFARIFKAETKTAPAVFKKEMSDKYRKG